LHVYPHLDCGGTLIYDFADGHLCLVQLTPAWTSLLLALVASRAIDLRNGQTLKVGHRSLEMLGRIVAVMPGPGNPVSPEAIGAYKRAIMRRIRKKLAAMPGGGMDGKRNPPHPIVHRKKGEGYGLHADGIAVVGVCVEKLEQLAREIPRPKARW